MAIVPLLPKRTQAQAAEKTRHTSSLSYQISTSYSNIIFLSLLPGHRLSAGQSHRAPAGLSPHRRTGALRRPEPRHGRAPRAGETEEPGEAPRGDGQLPASAEPAQAGAGALGARAREAQAAGRGGGAEAEGERGRMQATGSPAGRRETGAGTAEADVPAGPGAAAGVDESGGERERETRTAEEAEEAQHCAERCGVIHTGGWTGEGCSMLSCLMDVALLITSSL